MKKFMPYLIIFVLGVIIGAVCRGGHFREVTKMSQTDTVVVYDTARYSRLELSTNSCRLNVPKISRSKYVYIPADSATIIYRDSVRYVTLPRQYFFTEIEDAQIWHSGIDSTIDSLIVFRNEMVISKTETATQTVTKRNGLSIGIEARYMTAFSVPVYFQYESRIKPWLSVYARVDYDVSLRQWGVQTGVRTQIQW